MSAARSGEGISTAAGRVKLCRQMAVDRSGPLSGRVFIVRHGKTARNAGAGTKVDLIRGWDDVPLDARGRQEAEEIASLFQECRVDQVIASDLARVAATGKQIATAAGAAFGTDPALRPWNLGDFQGQPSAEVIPLLTRYVRDGPGKAVPGGESFNSFKGRFLKFLQAVLGRAERDRDGVTVLVTSYRGIKLSEAWIAAGAQDETLDLKTFFTDNMGPGAVFELHRGPDNWHGHLVSRGFGPHVKTA